MKFRVIERFLSDVVEIGDRVYKEDDVVPYYVSDITPEFIILKYGTAGMIIEVSPERFNSIFVRK